MDRKASIVTIRSGGSKSPLFFCPDLGGSVHYARNFLPYIDKDRPLFGFRPLTTPGGDVVGSFESITKVFALHLCRSGFAGPYHLVGYSLSAYVAFETARQLSALNQDVGLVALLDADVPRKCRAPRDALSGSRQFILDLFHWVAFNVSFNSAKYWKLRAKKILGLFISSPVPVGAVVIGRGYRRVVLNHMPLAYRELIGAMYDAKQNYQLGDYAGRVFVYRARVRGFLEWTPFDMGWSTFVKGGVEVIPVPGNHTEMLEDKRMLARIAEDIVRCVEKIDDRRELVQ